MLFSGMLVNVGRTQETPVLYVNPAVLPVDGSIGHPGDVYDIAINVANVTDLWSAGFSVKIYPYAHLLVASDIKEGDFLKQGGYKTVFVYTIDLIKGLIKIGVSRRVTYPLPTVGASGDGTLATLKLTVVEAGNSPIELVDTKLLNHLAQPIVHNIVGGYYYGMVVDLVHLSLANRPRSITGDGNQIFHTKVRNDGDMPLYVKVAIDSVRIEDGTKVSYWAGQTWTTAPPREPEYYYVDGFTNDRSTWTKYGSAPYLNAIEDGNYIEAPDGDALQDRFYTFQDIDLSDGAKIKTVTLEGYTNGPYDEGHDYDIYNGVNFAWIGSLYATGDWKWVGTRWADAPASDMDSTLLTEAGFNGFMALVYNYNPSLVPGAGNIIDCMRLKVEFYPPVEPATTPVYVCPPGGTLTLDDAAWVLRDADLGTYATTATAYFSYYGTDWFEAAKVQTKTWHAYP
jgi:hypothetical protein